MNVDSSSNSNHNPKKRTLSTVIAGPNEEDEKQAPPTTTPPFPPVVLGPIFAILAQEGWVDAPEVCVLELLCRDSKNSWCSDEAVWKPLALRAWPHLITAATSSENHNDTGDDKDEQQQQQQRPVIAGVQVESYKSVFCDARLWLTVSAEQVKGLDKWSNITHCDVECGRCGCNCTYFFVFTWRRICFKGPDAHQFFIQYFTGTEGMCGGIPIKIEFRWEKKNQKVRTHRPPRHRRPLR
jgi:hypothetical protein